MQLLTLRAKAGWSQEFVARQLDVSRQTVIDWERGKYIPNAINAIRIARLFGVSVEELMEVSK